MHLPGFVQCKVKLSSPADGGSKPLPTCERRISRGHKVATAYNWPSHFISWCGGHDIYNSIYIYRRISLCVCLCLCLCDRAVGKVSIFCFIQAHLLIISVTVLTIYLLTRCLNKPSPPTRTKAKMQTLKLSRIKLFFNAQLRIR